MAKVRRPQYNYKKSTTRQKKRKVTLKGGIFEATHREYSTRKLFKGGVQKRKKKQLGKEKIG